MLQYRDWYGTQYWSERGDYTIQYLVMHDTEGPRAAALAWWSSTTNPYKSSAHDLIDSDGVVWRCVPYEKAAHHCGGSTIPGVPTGSVDGTAIVNLVSIGIELEYPAAPASPPWPQVQIDAAVELVQGLVATYRIPRANVYRHADIDPQNRSDPRNFAWEEFLNRVFAPTAGDLIAALRNAAWNASGIPYNPDAAFAKYARQRDLGNPETPEFDFSWGGQAFRGQGFSKAIIYARVGQWDQIKEVNW